MSIEPIVDFDIKEMVWAIERIRPRFVTIGADSKGHDLPEPQAKKVNQLVYELSKITEVKIKSNLRRLME